MSTYYYMVCDKHLERTHCCSRTAGGIGQSALGDSPYTLGPFIVTHCGCPVRIVSEHEDDAYDERYTDWNRHNLMDMYWKNRD